MKLKQIHPFRGTSKGKGCSLCGLGRIYHDEPRRKSADDHPLQAQRDAKTIAHNKKEYAKYIAAKVFATTKIDFILLDAKEFSDAAAQSLKHVLEKSFNVYVYHDPRHEGSDQYGFVLSNLPLNDEQIAAVCVEEE